MKEMKEMKESKFSTLKTIRFVKGIDLDIQLFKKQKNRANLPGFFEMFQNQLKRY